MKTKLMLFIFALLIVFAFTTVQSQEKQTKEKKTTKVEKAKTEKPSENLMCTVMPEMKAKKSINYTYKGKKYYFCCKDCLAKFKKEPEKYAKK